MYRSSNPLGHWEVLALPVDHEAVSLPKVNMNDAVNKSDNQGGYADMTILSRSGVYAVSL